MELSELNACMEAGAMDPALWATQVLNVSADSRALYVDYMAVDGEVYIVEIVDGTVVDIEDSFLL